LFALAGLFGSPTGENQLALKQNIFSMNLIINDSWYSLCGYRFSSVNTFLL